MNTNDPPPALAAPKLDEAARAQLQQDLAHRFRHTLRTGQASPLLHLVLRYKQEVQPCTAPT